MAAWNQPKYAVFVCLTLASTEFRKIPQNIEIPQKWANSAAQL